MVLETPPVLDPVKRKKTGGKDRKTEKTKKKERTECAETSWQACPTSIARPEMIAGECGGKAEEEETAARSRSRRGH